MSDLEFEVQYYNDDHKDQLQELSVAEEISDAVQHGLVIPKPEFQVYSVFREQKLSRSGWKTYDELKRKLPARLKIFEEYFDVSNKAVRSQFANADDRDSALTEAAGVGAALSAVSSFYGLTEADWEKIPVSQTKDLDFEIAVDKNDTFVEVEAKGTITDKTNVTANISGFKHHIEEKKSVQRDAGNHNSLIGVITAFPTIAGRKPIVRLLDPPIEQPVIEPERYKLLARLHFYWRELSFISKSYFLSALATRISALSVVKDFKSLSGQPLLDRNGEPQEPPSTLLQNRSTVGIQEFAFGEVIHFREQEFIFYGFQVNVVQRLLEQSHSSIREMQYSSRSNVRIVNGRVPDAVLLAAELDPEHYKKTSSGNRRVLRFDGEIHELTSGRVWGIIKVRQEAQLNIGGL